VSVLPASERIETLELVDGNAATAIIKALRAHFTYTVVDCEHHPTDRTLTAFDAADRIVVVTQLNVAAVRSAQRTLALFRRLGYDDDKIVVVANRAQPSDLISADDAARVLERELFWRLPNDYRASEAALTRGVPVLESDPASALARAYLTLAAKLGVGDDADAPAACAGRAAGVAVRPDLQPREEVMALSLKDRLLGRAAARGGRAAPAAGTPATDAAEDRSGRRRRWRWRPPGACRPTIPSSAWPRSPSARADEFRAGFVPRRAVGAPPTGAPTRRAA
jgi:hypothetical protein